MGPGLLSSQSHYPYLWPTNEHQGFFSWRWIWYCHYWVWSFWYLSSDPQPIWEQDKVTWGLGQPPDSMVSHTGEDWQVWVCQHQCSYRTATHSLSRVHMWLRFGPGMWINHPNGENRHLCCWSFLGWQYFCWQLVSGLSPECQRQTMTILGML